jgi:hypothetical protein
MRITDGFFPLRGRWLAWILVPGFAMVLSELMLGWLQWRSTLPTIALAAPGSLQVIPDGWGLSMSEGMSLAGHSPHQLRLGPLTVEWSAMNSYGNALSAGLGYLMDFGLALVLVTLGLWNYERGRRSAIASQGGPERISRGAV